VVIYHDFIDMHFSGKIMKYTICVLHEAVMLFAPRFCFLLSFLVSPIDVFSLQARGQWGLGRQPHQIFFLFYPSPFQKMAIWWVCTRRLLP